MTSYVRHVRQRLTPDETEEMRTVDELADRLREHVDGTSAEIARLHVFGASSSAVQAHFSRLLKAELGFGEEIVLTPQAGLVTHARPDFFFSLGHQRGILAEVERGGTTTNNHDLKDLWKTHVAPDAHHLFLLVPQHNFRADGTLARNRSP